MVASRIKGITVEIGGDVQGLEKALSSVNKSIRDTQSQLRDVEKALKLDPTNTELLAQKQRLLAEAIGETKDKLDALKTAEKQVQAQFEQGKVSQSQYEALQREIVTTEKNLESLEKQARSSNAALENMANSAKSLGSSLTRAGKKMAPVSAAAAGVLGGAYALVTSTAEQSADYAKLEVNAKKAGVSLELVEKAMNRLYAVTQEEDSNIEALSNLFKAGVDNSNLYRAVELLSGAVIQFPDTIKIESLADSLQETVATGQATGQFAEILGRLGVNTELFAKKLESTQSEAGRLDYALHTLSTAGMANVANGYFRTNQELTNSLSAQYEMNRAMVELGDALRPVVAELLPVLVELLKSFTQWLQTVDTGTLKMAAGFLAVTAAVSPMLMALGGLFSAGGGILSLFSKLPGVFAGLSSALSAIPAVVGSAVSAIGPMLSALLSIPGLIVAVIAAIAVFGDEIQAGLKQVDEFLQTVFLRDWTETFGAAGEALNALFSSVSNWWDAAKDIINGVIDFIRGIVTGDLDRVLDGMVSLFKGAFELVLTVVLAPINAIIAAINFLIDMLNSFLQWLNSFRLPDFLGGGQIFNFGEVDKLGYLNAKEITNKLGSAFSGSSTTQYEKAIENSVKGNRSVTVNNYNSINADNLAQVARMEKTLNGQRATMRMGYAGG